MEQEGNDVAFAFRAPEWAGSEDGWASAALESDARIGKLRQGTDGRR